MSLRAMPDPEPCPECAGREHGDSVWSVCLCPCHSAPLTEAAFRKSMAQIAGNPHLKAVK